MTRLCLILIVSLAVACPATSCRRQSPPPTPLKKMATRPMPLANMPVATAARAKESANSQPATQTQATQPVSAVRQAFSRLDQEAASLAIKRVFSDIYQAATQAAADSRDPYIELLQAGDRALAKGDYTAAQNAFRKAGELQPHRLEAFEGLAATLSASNQFAAAAEIYAKIADLAAQLRRASSGPATGEDSLSKDYERLQRAARHNQAVSLARNGQLGEAQDIYRRLLADEPSNVRYRFNLAVLLQARQQLADAVDAWREVLADASSLPDGDAAFAWSCLGQLLMDLEKPAEAMDAYVQATKLAPQDPVSWLNYSVSARACGSLGKAIVAGKRAAALAEKDDALHSHLGGLYLELYRQTNDASHLRAAMDAWSRSLDLNPRQPELAKLVDHYRSVLQASTSQASATRAGNPG